MSASMASAAGFVAPVASFRSTRRSVPAAASVAGAAASPLASRAASRGVAIRHSAANRRLLRSRVVAPVTRAAMLRPPRSPRIWAPSPVSARSSAATAEA